MIGLVLVTHGNLAKEFISAMQHVVGRQEQVEAVCIGPEDDMEMRRAEILKKVGEVDKGHGAIVLTDMFGGTPSNLAISIMDRAKVEIIAGINLPMLIKLASLRKDKSLKETVEGAQEAGKKYPLLITQYSGPNSQQVKNNWSLSWLNYLAQEGYIVACIDPRGTAARGEEFRKCTYMQLGKLESDDMIAAAKWLATQPDVDVKNIGIWGWSYGGFMSSLCIMKGNDIFTTAIAVAPVTHYKYYDSIYTERYMRTPAENERGYEDNAPLNWADKLKGNLLICHGTADDNVHVQNTYELAERLVQANKQFDMAIYTNRNHSIFGGNTTLQLYNRFVKYLNEHMKR